MNAVTCGGAIFVAGYRDLELFLIRSSWQEVDRAAKTWAVEPYQLGWPIVLAADPRNEPQLLVHVPGGRAFKDQRAFPVSHAFPDRMSAGGMAGISAGIVAVDRTAHGITWLLDASNGELTLNALGTSGEFLSTESVPVPDLSDYAHGTPQVDPVLHARDNTVYVGVADELMIFDRAKPGEVIELDRRITSLVGSLPHTRTRIAATFDRGGRIWWEDFSGRHDEAFSSDLDDPIACFNRGGYLIVAGRDRCEVYGTQGRRLEFAGELANLPAPPIAVLSGPKSHQFAIVTGDGRILVYEL